LSIVVLGLSILIAPVTFAKGDKNSVSPQLYKKLNKAEKLIANKDYRGAQQSLQATLNTVSKGGFEQATVLRSLASAYALQENYRKATDTLAKCIKLNALPKSQQQAALLNLGQLYMATDQYRKAINTLENWLATNRSSDGQLYIMLAKAHAQLKQYRQAVPYVEKALRHSKNPPTSWHQLQFALYIETKNSSKAAVILQKMIRKQPEKFEHWQQLVAIYLQSNNYTKAATIKHLAYEKGFLTKEKEILDLVNLFFYINSPYKAATILKQELKAKRISSNSKNWELLANAWTQAREFNKALSALDTASRLNNKGQLYHRMGNIYTEQEKWPLAVVAFNKALQKGGLKKTGKTHLMLGISYYEQKKFAQARASFARAKGYKESQKAARQWLNYMSDV
jgi:tetratricopeptide (TPR) repeat protein